MSIDLDIFPTSSRFFSWGELKDKFLELLTPEDVQRLGKVSLLNSGSDEVVTEDQKLYVDSSSSNSNFYYYLSLDIPNTLGISIYKNEPEYIDEFDALEDYGRNLDAATIRALAQKWRSIGHFYGITTNAGRSRWEPPLFVALAAAIAHMSEGYVIVMSDNFTKDVGVYTPDVFQQAQMTLTRFMQ